MEKYLKRLPEGILELIYRARAVSEEMNVRAFLVGGFVRDLLLSLKNYDLDIAVEGEGIAFAERFCRGTGCRLLAHKRFGTATVHCPAAKIDFASARRESYPQPAALPVVSVSTIKDDLFRRDFTINTLAISLAPAGFGRLLDLYKGKEDLEAGIVRILHERSFIDDPTRILRAVRFEQRFGFRIELHTRRRLSEAARAGMLNAVQPQRLRDELLLIMKEDFPERAVMRLQELAGWDFLSPRVKVNAAAARLFERIRDQARWFETQCSPRRRLEVWVMYLAALFSGLKPQEALSLCRKFGFARGITSRIISYLAALREVERPLSRGKLAASALFKLLDPLPYEVILLVSAQGRNRNVSRHVEEFFRRWHGTCVSISGHDLKRLGIAPGPQYQRIFRRLLEAKLEGRVRTKEDELEFVARMNRKGLR